MMTVTKKYLDEQINALEDSISQLKPSTVDMLQRYKSALKRGPINGKRYAIFMDCRDFA